MFRIARRARIPAVAMVCAACGDIVHPDPHSVSEDRMIVVAVLDPTAVRHAITASPVEDFGPRLSGAIATMHHRTSPAGSASWSPVATARAVGDEIGDEEERLCQAAWLAHHLERRRDEAVCMILDAALAPGETYRVEVSADGRRTAVGTTRTVGDFQVEQATLSTMNASPFLSFSWTPSPGAHRYLAGLRRWQTRCIGCSEAWFADLDSTSYAGPVPQEFVDSAGPIPAVAVAALDRHYHAFLTSGYGSELTAVPPVMNVEGGLGVVGSAIVRTLPAVVGTGVFSGIAAARERAWRRPYQRSRGAVTNPRADESAGGIP